ncbi:hypothetical protein Q3G72_011885 [Acer saccharum]|nr:hypothetical protein Q3G72_011885 [Acer saccharum]
MVRWKFQRALRNLMMDLTNFIEVIDNGPDFVVKDKAGIVAGLKVGKWNRWARDGVRQDYGLEFKVYLGKRCLNEDGANGDKRLKLVHFALADNVVVLTEDSFEKDRFRENGHGFEAPYPSKQPTWFGICLLNKTKHIHALVSHF